MINQKLTEALNPQLGQVAAVPRNNSLSRSIVLGPLLIVQDPECHPHVPVRVQMECLDTGPWGDNCLCVWPQC